MRLLVSGCTDTMNRLMPERPERLGVLLTPSNGNAEWWPMGTVWACDNDCFNGLNATRYLRLMARILKFKSRPVWVACPDVVADANATLRSFAQWQPMLKAIGLPVALVLQDGMTIARLRYHMDRIAAVFVGGSTDWKLSDDAIKLCVEAKGSGKLVHVGRVNTMRRILYFARRARDAGITIDSFDGSGWSRFGNIRIPKGIAWIDKALRCRQNVMFGGVA